MKATSKPNHKPSTSTAISIYNILNNTDKHSHSRIPSKTHNQTTDINPNYPNAQIPKVAFNSHDHHSNSATNMANKDRKSDNTPYPPNSFIQINKSPQFHQTYYRSILYEVVIALYFCLLLLTQLYSTQPQFSPTAHLHSYVEHQQLNTNNMSNNFELVSVPVLPSQQNSSNTPIGQLYARDIQGTQMRITVYCILFVISELIKYIFYINDSTDPLNMRAFKKTLILLTYLIKIDMVYLLIRLVYGLQSIPSLLIIIHFAVNDLKKTNHASPNSNTHSSSTLNSTHNNMKNSNSSANNQANPTNNMGNISRNNNANHGPQAQPATTTITTTSSFLPLSLSTSKTIQLLNPLLLYCFCKTIYSHHPQSTQSLHHNTLANLSLLFLIFLLVNLVIGSELRMVLQGERCWFLGRTTTIITTQSVISNGDADNPTLINKVQKVSTSYDKSQALKTMVMCGCVCLMLENLLLVFQSVQQEIGLAIIHTLILTATAQYLYISGDGGKKML